MSVIVVAELGINWQGDPELALRMVDAAADAGCDAVKVQVFRAAEFCAPMAMYRSERQVDFFRRFEMGELTYKAVARRCGERDVRFVATVTTPELAESLSALADYLKIGSDDLTNGALALAVSGSRRGVILSTGMATAREIKRAVVMSAPGPDYLLHCVSLYPCPTAKANLARILALQKQADEVCAERVNPYEYVYRYKIGYSDHTEGHESALAAVALGAQMVEKHFTLDRELPGPDHKFSETPETMAALVRSIRSVEKSLGDGLIDPEYEELRMRSMARRQVVASGPMRCGLVLSEGALCAKRTGGVGEFDAGEMECLYGRKLTRDVETDYPLKAEDLE
jgi:N,N'-diacetyllegionaminate synthase